MLRSLRFRLPALFLLGIVLAVVVATLIAVRFFQSYTRSHAASELRAESAGIESLYQQKAAAGRVSRQNLELALGGDRLFWVPRVPGASLLAGPVPQLPRSAVPLSKILKGELPTFNLHLRSGGYFGVGRVVKLAGLPVGVLVVAEPEWALRSRWRQLACELALAFGIGTPVAGV